MSADNYYIVRKHPLGGYAAVMGFESDLEQFGHPDVPRNAPSYLSVQDALRSVLHEYAEYGHEIHPECEEDA